MKGTKWFQNPGRLDCSTLPSPPTWRFPNLNISYHLCFGHPVCEVLVHLDLLKRGFPTYGHLSSRRWRVFERGLTHRVPACLSAPKMPRTSTREPVMMCHLSPGPEINPSHPHQSAFYLFILSPPVSPQWRLCSLLSLPNMTFGKNNKPCLPLQILANSRHPAGAMRFTDTSPLVTVTPDAATPLLLPVGKLRCGEESNLKWNNLLQIITKARADGLYPSPGPHCHMRSLQHISDVASESHYRFNRWRRQDDASWVVLRAWLCAHMVSRQRVPHLLSLHRSPLPAVWVFWFN